MMKKNVEDYLAFKRGEIRMPGHLKQVKEGKGILYKNELLEKTTRSPIWVPQSIWFVISLTLLILAFVKTELSALMVILLFFTGILSWSFVEYAMHRFFYHTETSNDVMIRMQFTMHAIHHQFPKESDRLAMPPIPGLILASIFYFIFNLIMGINALAFFPGFTTGYLIYITLHYYQHVAKSPNYKPWQRLWSHHKGHHFSNPYVAFGVSTRFWDWVFGTMPKKSKVKEEEEMSIG
jgi:4-hydroxysphinganine ceramide fatty acyl 2-hydroxylase